MAIRLYDYGYSSLTIGIAFGIPAMIYAISCIFIYLLTSKLKKRGLILIGLILLTLAMLMIGGTD